MPISETGHRSCARTIKNNINVLRDRTYARRDQIPTPETEMKTSVCEEKMNGREEDGNFEVKRGQLISIRKGLENRTVKGTSLFRQKKLQGRTKPDFSHSLACCCSCYAVRFMSYSLALNIGLAVAKKSKSDRLDIREKLGRLTKRNDASFPPPVQKPTPSFPLKIEFLICFHVFRQLFVKLFWISCRWR